MQKLKVMTIVGTRPEIIRLSAVMKAADKYFDHVLVHTGQNWDYTLNQVFFEELGVKAPDYTLDSVGADLGETVGNIIAKSYKVMREVKPDALLDLGGYKFRTCGLFGKKAEDSRVSHGSRQSLF